MHRRHRQGRWLHARISEHLEGALKREAERRRLPVSLLVRNVLEGALELVENIVATAAAPRPNGGTHGTAAGARRAGAHARAGDAASADALADVYGWQEIILNRGAACARCAATLVRGALAFRGLRDGSGPPVFMCPPCVRRLGQKRGEPQEETS